jgi:hypothetical protein
MQVCVTARARATIGGPGWVSRIASSAASFPVDDDRRGGNPAADVVASRKAIRAKRSVRFIWFLG